MYMCVHEYVCGCVHDFVQVCVCVCDSHVWKYVCRIEDGMRVPGTCITGSCKFQYGCRELNLILNN